MQVQELIEKLQRLIKERPAYATRQVQFVDQVVVDNERSIVKLVPMNYTKLTTNRF